MRFVRGKSSKGAGQASRSADNTAGKQRGRPFRAGESGNPAGRPKGSRNHATRMLEDLLEREAEQIGRMLVTKAKDGDLTAARIVMDRILPVRRDKPVSFQVPRIAKIADVPMAMGAIVTAVASGELTPSEAANLSSMVDCYTRAVQATEFEARLAVLENEESSSA